MLSIKKLEIEKTKPDIFVKIGGLSFFDFQLFLNKISQANKLSVFTCTNLALVDPIAKNEMGRI